ELHRSGDEAAWWQKLNIDPLPVALRLWQHTRLTGDGLAPSEYITPSQAAQELDISVQDRVGTNDEGRADVESAVSKGGIRTVPVHDFTESAFTDGPQAAWRLCGHRSGAARRHA